MTGNDRYIPGGDHAESTGVRVGNTMVRIPVEHCDLRSPPRGTILHMTAVWNGERWLVTSLKVEFGK